MWQFKQNITWVFHKAVNTMGFVIFPVPFPSQVVNHPWVTELIELINILSLHVEMKVLGYDADGYVKYTLTPWINSRIIAPLVTLKNKKDFSSKAPQPFSQMWVHDVDR